MIAILAEQLGVAPESISEDTILIKDLAADSLDQVELVLELEETLDLE